MLEPLIGIYNKKIVVSYFQSNKIMNIQKLPKKKLSNFIFFRPIDLHLQKDLLKIKNVVYRTFQVFSLASSNQKI